MKNVRFSYLDEQVVKFFTTRKAFIEWAKDESHNGKYYVSYHGMTVCKTREQVIGHE